MRQLAVISGKGGTGKTALSASFAALSPETVLADCDVDAANLHLLLHPDVLERHAFSGGKQARLAPELCTGCGSCWESCRFEAIRRDETGEFHIDPIACEGCALCSRVCPTGAIGLEDADTGEWYLSQTGYGPFVHARLNIGAENSGKLVTEVRQQARALAERLGLGRIIIDGPPGIGCPVVAALSGVDLSLVVTEPTPSGIQDMGRVIQTARHFGIPAACCINKSDLNPRLAEEIDAWCGLQGVEVVGHIPFDVGVAEAITRGRPPVLFLEDGTGDSIREVWRRTARILEGGPGGEEVEGP